MLIMFKIILILLGPCSFCVNFNINSSILTKILLGIWMRMLWIYGLKKKKNTHKLFQPKEVVCSSISLGLTYLSDVLYFLCRFCFCSVTKLYLTLRTHELQHTRFPCSSLSLWVCSNSCPLSWWWYRTISSSVAPPPALNFSQHHGLFQWVSSSHHVAKVLELQHQSFQWIFRTDFL